MVIKLRAKRYGKRIEERIFMGSDENHLALTGTLMLRVGEWQVFGAALLLGASQMKGHLTVLTPDSETVVQEFAEATKCSNS